MTQLSELLGDVLPEVPKCSDLMASQHIEDAAIDFYKKARLKNFTLGAIAVVIDTSSYALANPAGWQLMYVRTARMDGRSMFPTSEEYLDLNWDSAGDPWMYELRNTCSCASGDTKNWRTVTSEQPSVYYMENPNLMRVVGIPSVAYAAGLVVNAVAHPAPGVTEIDDWIYNSHRDLIAMRAIATLSLLKGYPFSDPRKAGEYLEEYESEMIDVAAAALRGYQRNDLPVLRTKSYAR